MTRFGVPLGRLAFGRAPAFLTRGDQEVNSKRMGGYMHYISDQELDAVIMSAEVRSALHFIRENVRDLPGFRARSFTRGYMKAYGLVPEGKGVEERPYDFAVNKHSLKCYIRPPGLRSLGIARKKKLLERFPEADMKAGELRITIKTVEDAKGVIDCLPLGSEQQVNQEGR